MYKRHAQKTLKQKPEKFLSFHLQKGSSKSENMFTTPNFISLACLFVHTRLFSGKNKIDG